MDAPRPSGDDGMLALIGGLLAAAVIAVGLFGVPPIDETE